MLQPSTATASYATNMSQKVMKFGGSGENGRQEQAIRVNVKRQVLQETQLNGDGYMTAIYNMLYLLQTRISKVMRGEPMDDEIFRTYFIRLFRGIAQMEKKFKSYLDEEEADAFVRFSKALPDLASLFKVQKQETSTRQDTDALIKNKKAFKRSQHEISKMIFGVGSTPAETKKKTVAFKIMPTKLLGFSRVQQIMINDRNLTGVATHDN
jgi:hypothetical protein